MGPGAREAPAQGGMPAGGAGEAAQLPQMGMVLGHLGSPQGSDPPHDFQELNVTLNSRVLEIWAAAGEEPAQGGARGSEESWGRHGRGKPSRGGGHERDSCPHSGPWVPGAPEGQAVALSGRVFNWARGCVVGVTDGRGPRRLGGPAPTWLPRTAVTSGVSGQGQEAPFQLWLGHQGIGMTIGARPYMPAPLLLRLPRVTPPPHRPNKQVHTGQLRAPQVKSPTSSPPPYPSLDTFSLFIPFLVRATLPMLFHVPVLGPEPPLPQWLAQSDGRLQTVRAIGSPGCPYPQL